MSKATRAMTNVSTTHDEQVIVVLVRGGCGGLERVIGLLRRRASRIATLNVTSGESDDESRVTIHLRCGRETAEQIAEHIRKLMDVSWTATFSVMGSSDAVLLREFALIRAACTPATRRDLVDVAQLFGARAVDVTENTITLEVSGSPESVEQLLRMLRPIGVYEVARTGRMAMSRGVEPDEAEWKEDAAAEE